MDLTGLMNVLFSFRPMYMLLFFFISGFVLVDYGMQFIDIQVQHALEELEDKISRKKKAIVTYERLHRRKKITAYNHRGFDFDGAAGHDLLVTDKIVNRI